VDLREGPSAICVVPGCDEPHHARSLCDQHYQVWRRTGDAPLPTIKAARHREWLIRRELTFGVLPEGMASPFASEDERRAAWGQYGPELTAECEALGIGSRPWAWWRYVAERPQYLASRPRTHDLTTSIRWSHEANVEKFAWLAEHGHLTTGERDRVALRGGEARARLDTGRERKAALGEGFGGDRELLAVAAAVEAAQ
jgi:hypothetical protein